MLLVFVFVRETVRTRLTRSVNPKHSAVTLCRKKFRPTTLGKWLAPAAHIEDGWLWRGLGSKRSQLLSPEEAIIFVRACWLIPRFNAPLPPPYSQGNILWQSETVDGSQAPAYLHFILGQKHHLCHYITAHNGFYRRAALKSCQHRHSGPDGISCKINWNFDVPQPLRLRDGPVQVPSNKAGIMSNAKLLSLGSTSAFCNLWLITPVRMFALRRVGWLKS